MRPKFRKSTYQPRNTWGLLVTIAAFVMVASDLRQSFKRKDGSSAVWASWIGEVPTAAELYGDSSNAFEDDDDEDEGLDSAATNEYPDGTIDQEQEQDQERDAAESGPSGVWAATGESIRKPMWADLEGWRRNKRDLEDRIQLAASRRGSRMQRNKADEEFAIDDGDEDAWVHDGIDDIHIDPETKRAASEISSSLADDGMSTIDSEYEPQPQPQQQQVANRTRVTTISEVIPMGADDSGDSTSLSSRYVRPGYLPASVLTLEQAVGLLEHQ